VEGARRRAATRRQLDRRERRAAPAGRDLRAPRRRRHKGVAFTVISEPVIGDRDFPGGEGLADPEGAAALELEAVVDVTGAWDALLMRRVRVASPWLAFAHGDGVEVAAERGPAAGAGVIDTSRTAGEYWSDTPKKFRRGMSNARNRAQRSGGVTSTAASGAGFEAAYDALLRLEDSGWKGRAGDSLVHRDADAANLRRFTPGAAGGAVHLLAIGGQTVAAALCVTVGRSRVALKFAYDEAHADLSPGKLILAEIIEGCCANPDVDRLDCLAWWPWQEQWAMVREPTFRIVAFGGGPRASAARLAWRVEYLRERMGRD
jgi:hypothetical protein